MENHHHHHQQSEASWASSLELFRSDVSDTLKQLVSNSKLESEAWWLQQCLDLPVAILTGSFAKLLADIDDYHPSQWEVASIDEYLKYSLGLLDLLNSIASSLSHLSQSKVALCHGIALAENSPSLALNHLIELQPKHIILKKKSLADDPERVCSGKEWVIHQALLTMKSVGFWAYASVLSRLCGDAKPYVGLMKSAQELIESTSNSLESNVGMMELKEVNVATRSLRSAIVNGKKDYGDELRELQEKFQQVEKVLDQMEKKSDQVFSKVLEWRNDLVESLRQQQPQ